MPPLLRSFEKSPQFSEYHPEGSVAVHTRLVRNFKYLIFDIESLILYRIINDSDFVLLPVHFEQGDNIL